MEQQISGNWYQLASTTFIKGLTRVTFWPTSSVVRWCLVGPYLVVVGSACVTQPIQSQQAVLVDICNTDGDRYRFGFNGQEKVNEWSGVGNHLDYGERGYDSRVGRWYSLDPLAQKYPGLSPYNFTNNNPILFVDHGGKDFGVKISNTNKTIVIVANIYTTNETSYNQALAGAGKWNEKKATVDGYAVTFQLNVIKPPSVSNEEAIAQDPGIVKNNGELKQNRLKTQVEKISAIKTETNARGDAAGVGNVYAGNKGKNSHSVNSLSDNGSNGNYVGGQTLNAFYSDMNTHDMKGDLGNKSELVGHEFGHLLGLDDEGKGPYFHQGGIMEYGTSLKPISDDDVKDVLNAAKNIIGGNTAAGDPNVKVLENTGTSDGSNPLGLKNP